MENVYYLGLGRQSSYMMQKAKITKEKINKFYIIQIRKLTLEKI